MSIHVMSWVWKHSSAKGIDKLVLLKIADSANDDGTDAWPSIDTIATECGIGRSTVKRCIGRLAELGEIHEEHNAGGPHDRRPDRRTNRFTVLMHGGPERTVVDLTGVHSRANGGSFTSLRGSALDPEPSLTIQEPSLNTNMSIPSTIEQEIFEYWKNVTGRELGHYKFTDTRKKLVRARLKDGYTPDDLKLALDGLRVSPWHNGDNPSKRMYDDLENALRDAKHVERFIEIASNEAEG